MTTERIRTEILEISRAIALMLAEREFPNEMTDLTPGQLQLRPEVQEVFESHSDVIEEALWGLHQTIRAKYTSENE